MTVTFWVMTDGRAVRRAKLGEWQETLGTEGFGTVACTPLFVDRKSVVVHTYLYGYSNGPGPGPYGIFRTIIEGGQHDWYKRTWDTFEEAAQGHATVVAAVESGEELP